MTRDTKARLIVFAVAVVVILAVGRAMNRRSETPTERAYRLCGEYALARVQVDRLVDNAAHSTLDRGGMLGLFEATFGREGAPHIVTGDSSRYRSC